MLNGDSILIKMKKCVIVSLFIPFLMTCGWFGKDRGTMENVDLAAATWLVAEQVRTQVNKEGVPVKPGSPSTTVTPVNGLFNLPPGKPVAAAALMGTIDPTGTTIVNDFDGDGILNQNETLSNVWVADYPQIETVIAPPVTLKIQILKNSSNQSDQIVSEINSDDFEESKKEGSDKIHQSELNERTVQFQDSFSADIETGGSHETSTSMGAEASFGYGLMPMSSVGMNYSTSAKESWQAKYATSSTTTKWADRPFKNNLDKDAWNLKSDSSTNKARKYRSDKSAKVNETSTVEPNAGVVRAALYIKNLSVNMPVKISNILCSLMFETPAGELVPMSSFRLRNDDYSLFEVEVYGGSDFGPYVVELTNLNTVEVEKAIAAGYTPKIMIVDYAMTHVPDSNYKSNLLNFSGNNLKIIEENAKGRTALVKVYGPGIREMYRVTAFDTPNVTNPCNTTNTDVFSPGISLKKALERIACSGNNITFKDYVIDLSEAAPTLAESRIYIKGIQSFGGISTRIPCVDETSTGTDGVTRTACVQKPYNQWTNEEKNTSGVWAVFSRGKFYSPTEYWTDAGSVRKFDPWRGTIAAPVVKGADSIVWAGDNYDLVYVSFKDFIKAEQKFGTNPLETGYGYPFNTKWDSAILGAHPYYPDTNSLFLGEVGFGEKIDLTIKLDSTKYLSPNFGSATDTGLFQYFTNFSYNQQTTTDRYTISQAADFELSMGFGGDRTDWYHIVRDLNNSDPYKLKTCGTTLDFINQTYNLCVQLPTLHPVVDPRISLVKLYIRPSLNNAYRRTIWPLHYSQVRKLRAELAQPAVIGNDTIQLNSSIGQAAIGDSIFIQGDSTTYKVTQIFAPNSDGSYDVRLDRTIQANAKKTTAVYVPSNITAPDVRLSVDSGFVSEWNTFVQSNFLAGVFDQPQFKPFLTGGAVSCSINPFHPAACLGFNPDFNAINWMGVYNEGVALWNSWADGGKFQDFLAGGLFRLTAASGKSYRLESSKTDFTVSTSTGATALDGVQMVSYGDTSLVVWKRDTAILGRYVRISTGTPIGATQFTINTAPSSTSRVFLKSNGSKAAIVWDNGNDIYISLRDLNTLGPIGSETKVDTISRYPGTAKYFDVAVGTDRTIVIYDSASLSSSSIQTSPAGCGPIGWDPCWGTQYVYNWQVLTKTYRNDTGALANTVLLSNKTDVRVDTFEIRNTYPRISASGNRALLAMHEEYYMNTGELRCYGIMGTIDLMTGTWVNPSTVVDLQRVIFQYSEANNGKGIVTYLPDGDPSIRYAKVWDLANNVAIGNPFVIENSMSGYYVNVSDNNALVTYTKGGQVYLKVIDLQSGAPLHTNLIPLSNMAGGTKYPGRSIASGNKVLAVWDTTDGGKRTIRGRLVDLTNFIPLGSGEFFISTTNEGAQTFPVANVSANTSLVTWIAQDLTQPRIRGAKIDLANPGALQYGLNNFFVAPLIERDYTVRARIKY
ncbi:LIC12048 family lipoprotein [Leptospira yasudae]|uniref:LIC12048 family lipoprotein n=1 Tax=Leptospira yasudae TaxID=2202201 RepID=UPI001FF0410F|nr:LIC12048 family lipoprotein [Leptospira yasudae]